MLHVLKLSALWKRMSTQAYLHHAIVGNSLVKSAFIFQKFPSKYQLNTHQEIILCSLEDKERPEKLKPEQNCEGDI